MLIFFGVDPLPAKWQHCSGLGQARGHLILYQCYSGTTTTGLVHLVSAATQYLINKELRNSGRKIRRGERRTKD
jgi:hypothetical protein